MTDWYPKRTIGSLPRDAAVRWGAREALVFQDRRWTHADVDREVDALAASLLALGVQPQDKVALWLVNRPELFFLFYAVLKVGAVAVPLNTRYRIEDLAVALRKADCAWLFAMDRSGPVDYAAMVRTALQEPLAHLKRVVMLGDDAIEGAIRWDEFRQSRVSAGDLQARAAAVDPDAPAMIIYTSGTTAAPKGVMHSHICVRAMQERSLPFGMTCGDVSLNYLPLFHLFGISIMMSSILCGAKQVVMDKFDGDEAIDLVERERVTMAYGFDTHWLAMLDAQKARPRDVSSLRIGQCASGSEDAIVSTYKVQELCLTTSGYGMTECWSWNALCFANSTPEQRCETSGIAMPGVEFRIRDPETGADVATGALGEIWIRSYTNMLGYYGEPQATAEVFDGEWLRTGDEGRLREDGYLQFVGRYKDMLKVGGENVAPAEVEALLLTMDGVAQAAVVGIPDAKLSEVPVAFVVAHESARLDAEALIAACRGRIASFKIPRAVHVVPDFPMTSTGKVQKAELRKRAKESAR
ncbi:class I adenylate-forming enzyme family protein [Ramlibacter sp.]|uniref:class I adenylate-forming enzyme family protein n=1 Tax=Ramlibacter sp. TaxID=1917967 RepID=UPI003D09A53B